jgi:hypothetical protein
MTEITLELNDSADETLLFALLQRMGLSFSTKKTESSTTQQREYDRKIIEQGVKTRDIDELIQDFSQSRQDRPLPFRHQ